MVVYYNYMQKKSNKYSLHESIGYLTYQASGAIRKEIAKELQERNFGIKTEEFAALIYIWDEDGQTHRALSEKLYRDKTTVTRLITGIENMGLVKRVAGQDDAREKRIFLTEKGKKLMSGVIKMVLDVLERAEKGIDPNDMKICKDVLRAICKNLP
ncbi:MAG: MarR family winged helix-turn-helix transcriptional regulator [Syntrophorhabdaceae bacterium]|nr:MarR family winged helix-turn-helix transcriptional regulator [Syntrophorhabdaceae bacterium]